MPLLAARDRSPERKQAKLEDDITLDGVSTLPKTPDMRRKIPKGYLSDSSLESSSPSSDGGSAQPLELPNFTPTVKTALRDGDCSAGIWNMVSLKGRTYLKLKLFLDYFNAV